MLNINEEVKETIKVISELFFSGNYEEAENLTDILNRLMEMLGNTNPFFLQFLNIQGRLLENKGDYQAAIEKYLIAISEYQRENNTNSLEYSRVIDNLGVTYLRIGDFSSAKPLLEESLKIRENTSEKDYIDIVTSFSNLGSYYLIIGELKEALKFYFRSLNILQNQCENKVFEATIMNNIGELYGQIYNDELAELYHYQALGIRRSILGEDTLDYAQSLVNLAQTFSVKENKKPLAKIFFEEAIRIYEKINSLKKTPHPDFFIIQSSYCSLLNDLGLIIEAENSLKKLLQTNVIALGKNNVFIGNIQLALAKNYAFQNKFYESSLLFSKGISNLEKYYKYNPNLVEPYLFLSLLFAKTGKWIDSYNTLTKAITIRDRITKNLVGFASEKQQLKYLSMIKQEISIIFFLIRCQSVNQSDFIALGMNYILRYKGISADMAAIKKECISVQDNSDIIAKYNKYLSLKKAVLNLQIGDSSFSDKFENEKLLKNLEIDLEILESELSEFIPDV